MNRDQNWILKGPSTWSQSDRKVEFRVQACLVRPLRSGVDVGPSWRLCSRCVGNTCGIKMKACVGFKERLYSVEWELVLSMMG